MAKRNFDARAREVYQLYLEGKYREALEANDRLAREFPGEAASTCFWRVCLRAMNGDGHGALQAMEAALTDGLWWSERQLRGESDLASLQGNPDFERMVEVCRERHSAAQVGVRPELLVRRPRGRGPHPLLIAIHGMGSHPGRDLDYWQPVVQQGWLLAMPQSSQLNAPRSYVWEDRGKAMAEIRGHYEALVKGYNLDTRRVILAGFSQGGALALQLTLRGLVPARGFLSVVPGQFAVEDLGAYAGPTGQRGVRGYLVAGGRDPRHAMFVQVCETLSHHGVPCIMEDHPEMGHEFPPDFEQSLEKALRFLLS